ncbi:diaminopimelate epimerase [Flammeovirgaceae bacterium SG7u.111]|nr:diaminopimelate epimerase [Flammeovirgaceae bacterium SG7u.132]WPO35342.1 diaminopimelate epimerase [Flammeovirgaceae bacterium SG7u.111]
MELHFVKYQGTGNDFVMIDDRAHEFDASNHQLITKLCHRRFGVGADGLILLRNRKGYDFEMVYFNADGHLGSMCGNGGRCTVHFAHSLGVFDKKTTFLAADGDHEASVAEGIVHLKMNDVSRVDKGDGYVFMDTGSPHYVAPVQNLKAFPVFEKGKEVRHSFMDGGTNVNFTEQKGDVLHVRTFERGVEDETLSCGTGVTASVIAANLNGTPEPVKVKVLGGELAVNFDKVGDLYTNIYLIGPAKAVFAGTFDLNNF